jgi:hypothetical protein
MHATTAALERSAGFPETSIPEIQDRLALKLAERALILADTGLLTDQHLAVARAALDQVSESGRIEPSSLSLRLLWAVASADDNEAAEVIRAADAVCVTHLLGLGPHRLAAIELLCSLPTPGAWRQELGPFAAPLYAEARGRTMAEAFAWLGEPSPIARHDGDDWPPRALTIGPLVLADVDIDMDALKQDEELRAAAPEVRVVPTASLRCYLGAGRDDPGLTPWVALGSAAASNGDDIHQHVAAMLAYFDKHGAPTEASFTCAAILAGVASKLLGPNLCALYADHLLYSDHEVALAKALRGVAAR